MVLLFVYFFTLPLWGFYAHKLINKKAVFCLPIEMAGFYKKNIYYLEEHSTNPDKRRYAVEGEAPRHYIDLDVYSDSVKNHLSTLYWKDAVSIYSEDTLMAYGIVPWQLQKSMFQLTKAFEENNAKAILRLSADLGHYIADANVPLHTTFNYNGKETNQLGIHAFWESRLPELFAPNYNFYVGKASYVPNVAARSWQAVLEAHNALDSVLVFEKELSKAFGPDKKYTIEERNRLMVSTYSKDFAEAYHTKLNSQVERQMKKSIKMIADFWYTAWVNAGQPDLSSLKKVTKTKEEKEEETALKKAWLLKILQIREEE